MTDHLWTTGETIGVPDASDGGAAGITTATTVQFQSAGSVTGVQYRAPNTLSGTWTIAIWEVTAADPPSTGTLLDSKNVTLAAGVWQDLFFNAPIPITPLTKLYRIGVWSSAGRYVATSGVFSAANFTSAGGFIKAMHNGDDTVGLGSIAQGTFRDNAAIGYPNGQAGAASYWTGPVFEPAGADLNVADSPGGGSLGSTPNTLTIDVAVADSPGGGTLGSSTETVIPGAAVNVPDSPGGGSLASTPTTVQTSSALADTAVMPLLLQILGCLQAQALTVTKPPANVQLRPGATFSPNADNKRDECCEGIAWVRPGPMYPSTDFPQQLTTVWAPGTNQWALQVELGIERCIPIIGTEVGSVDGIPSAAQWLAATQAAMDDRAMLRRTICCIVDLLGKRKVVVGQITPLENEGTCGGEVVILTVLVQACDGC
jgi:hypothetical protein